MTRLQEILWNWMHRCTGVRISTPRYDDPSLIHIGLSEKVLSRGEDVVEIFESDLIQWLDPAVAQRPRFNTRDCYAGILRLFGTDAGKGPPIEISSGRGLVTVERGVGPSLVFRVTPWTDNLVARRLEERGVTHDGHAYLPELRQQRATGFTPVYDLDRLSVDLIPSDSLAKLDKLRSNERV